MKIYGSGGEVLFDVTEKDDSYRQREIMGEQNITLYFSLTGYIDIPIGAYCVYQNERYTVVVPPSVTQNGERSYDYIVTFEGEQYALGKYKLCNTIDHRLKFSYTGRPQEHLQLLVDNLNNRDDGWQVGECIDAPETCVSYNHNYCVDALKMIAEAFETEWEIKGKTIHLRKVEYNKDNPLPLAYGCGKGFKSGVKRDNSDDSAQAEILYVQGGEKNLDSSKYGSSELLLPKGQELEYEGRTYVTDNYGYSIHRADKSLSTKKEDSIDLSNIYPKRVGEVTSAEEVDSEQYFWDFLDTSIPDNLDYGKYIIAGERMTVIFQTGMLAGQEAFEVKYRHSDRRFQLVPAEVSGQTMPNRTFCPRVGDKYAVFGCMLPDEYFCDNDSKTGASWDMFREAAKHLYENENPRFSFTGNLDGIWCKRDWLNIGGKIVLGGYVRFTADFVPEGVLIRIKSIKDYLLKPHSPTIELSNMIAGASVSSELRKIAQGEVVAEDNRRELIQFTKRRFRDAMETAEMLEQSLLNFTGSISPISVRAMQMIVGDESLQFMFVSDRVNPVQVAHNVVFDPETKILTADGGILRHMTLGITSLSSTHSPDEYRYWDIEPFTSPVLTDPQAYYLYAKVSVEGDTGLFYLSPTAIKMDGVEGYYHLLVGILNREYKGGRSWAQFYGFSEITPGQMLVERIVSPDGTNYMDFVRNAFRIGNENSYLDWNNEDEDTLSTLKMKLDSAIVKNRLDVLGEAFIAGFKFSNEIIKSTLNTGGNPSMLLDGKSGKIELESSMAGGDHSQDTSIGSRIGIRSSNGTIETRGLSGNAVSYMSPTGVFCNKAGTDAYPSVLGGTHKASIVGLGYGNVSKGLWNNDNFVAGVFGDAANDGDAPAYGGFFQNLMAAGLLLNVRFVEQDETVPYDLSKTDSMVIGLANNNKDVFLPTDSTIGRVVFVRQWGSGKIYLKVRTGQHMYDNASECGSNGFEVVSGETVMCVFAVVFINNVRTECWLCNSFKGGA